jgi:rare lipoprotein A
LNDPGITDVLGRTHRTAASTATMSHHPFILAVLLVSTVVFSGCATTHRPSTPPASAGLEPVPGWKERGVASWYGPGYKGKATASGIRYDPSAFTAAHRTLAFGSIVEVRNLQNNRVLLVEINDRGPFIKDRIIDLSERAAQDLGLIGPGTATVELRLMRRRR